jgi:RimJ/RimL family protein N-acetyltransferase
MGIIKARIMHDIEIVFQTERLKIRKAMACDADVEFFYRLWTNPDVMTMVGFPRGLRITRDEIRAMFEKTDDSEYNRRLVVEIIKSGTPIGECKLGLPDAEGISETDVKLFPEYWGNGYGTEIKRGLVDYLFRHTDCKAVKATPNKNNIASQKMQTDVGGKRVGDGVFRFPEEMRDYTCVVPHYVYMVFREDWEKMQV